MPLLILMAIFLVVTRILFIIIAVGLFAFELWILIKKSKLEKEFEAEMRKKYGVPDLTDEEYYKTAYFKQQQIQDQITSELQGLDEKFIEWEQNQKLKQGKKT